MKRSLHLFMLRGGVFVCIVMLLLTSCENFLKANQVKSEIEEAIEIANSSPILYHIIADKDSGTVSPSQATLKKKQSVNLLFTPAEGWNFICWEALDRTTGELLPDAIKFENPQKLETKATILNPRQNLMIHPKCTRLPMVSSIVPAYDSIGCYQDSTITITFNKPVEPATFGDFSCVSIVDETGRSLFSMTPENSYFQVPQFDQGDTQLNIRTIKEKFILDVNGEKQRSDITVTINFSNIKDKEGLNVTQNAPYTYRISKDVERIPPEVKSLILYKRGFAIQEETITEITDPDYPVRYYVKDTDDYTELSSCDFLAIENDKNNSFFTQNHVGKKIYFDANVLDQDSGYKQLTIKETLIRTVAASPVSQEVKKTTSVAFGDEFAERTDRGTIITAPEYTFKSTMDGVVRLDFIFEDWASNTTTKSWYVIKDTNLDMNAFNKPKPTDPMTSYSEVPDVEGHPANTQTGKKEMYSYVSRDLISTDEYSRIGDNNGNYTETITFSGTDTYYDSKNESANYEMYWGYDKKGITNIPTKNSNLSFSFTRNVNKDCYVRIIVYDIVGNYYSEVVTIPKQNSVVSLLISNEYNSAETVSTGSFDTKDVCFKYKPNENSSWSVFRVSRFYSPSDGKVIIRNTFQFSNYFFTDETLTPDGIYAFYEIPYNKSSFGYFYGTLSEPFIYYHNVQNTSQVNTPQFPDSFSYSINDPLADSSGIRTIHVTLPESFIPTEGCHYGTTVYVDEINDFDFTVKGRSSPYKIYLCAYDANGVFYLSDCYQSIDASYDNTPPRFTTGANAKIYINNCSAPNEVRLRQSYLPSDAPTNAAIGLYGSQKGYVDFDYYFKKDDRESPEDKALPDIQRNTLKSLTKKTISYPQSATQIKLDFLEPVESYYDIIFDLKDKNGNTRIITYVVSNIVTCDIPTVTITGSNPAYTASVPSGTLSGGVTAYFDTCYIDNNDWIFYKRSTTDNDADKLNATFTDMKAFLRCALNGKENSLYSFICPSYELMTAEQKAQTCNSKSILPAINNSYQVFYDAPSFAHTMAFPTNMLEDLETKTQEALELDNTLDYETAYIAVWETKGREYNLKLLNDQWAPGTATYKVPVNEIEKDFSYITIFHFADGSTEATEIYQKK